jgi:N-sulfoglucosamine sulfohydrolase
MKKLHSTSLVHGACLLFLAQACQPGEPPGKGKAFPDASKKKPNILLFLVDDLGTNDAGCYGNPVIKTPGVDALAREGTRFDHAYCTSPSCAASRSVILTGKYNHATAHYGHSHFEHHFSAFDDVLSLPVILDSLGYRTMRAGKLHVAPHETVFRFNDYMPKKEKYPDRVWKPLDEAPYYPHSGAEVSPVEMAEDLREFISRKDDDPFFLYFCTWDPHHPFRREGSDTICPADVIVPPHMNDTPENRAELAKYYMSMQRADKGLQHLMKILKESGQWDNTIILFTSDNGRPFMGAKPNLYDPGIRLPFIFRDPRQDKKGLATDAMVSFTDIAPTLLDYAGADLDLFGFHGRSFRELIQKGRAPGFDTVYASHCFHELQQPYHMRMIKDRKFKFIWNLNYEMTYPILGRRAEEMARAIAKGQLERVGERPIKDFLKRPQYELYDMTTDPNELKNLAYDPVYEEQVHFYINKLYRFQEKTNDPWKNYQGFAKLQQFMNL